jgi:hypothetical protein
MRIPPGRRQKRVRIPPRGHVHDSHDEAGGPCVVEEAPDLRVHIPQENDDEAGLAPMLGEPPEKEEEG